MEYFWDLYVPEKPNRNDILVSPLKATLDDLKGLPPTLIVTAEVDVLRDEAENFARKLMDAGVSVSATRVLGVLHSFISKSELFDQDSLFALDMAIGALKRAFG
jgi:acetyl esterase